MEALIYFALWAGLIFLMMRFGCGAHVMGHGQGHGDTPERGMPRRSDEIRWVPPKTDIDPVCGKTVHTAKAKPSVHDGMVYYFCSHECRERFEGMPDHYAGQKTGEQPKQMDHANG
jgi:YHS domain-containing protein